LKSFQLWLPRSAALDDGVGEQNELSGACDERGGVWLSGSGQPGIEALEGRVPAEGGGQCRGAEQATRTTPPAGDVALAAMAAAVVVEWRMTGQSGGLLAGDAAEFGHAHHGGE